MNTYDVMEAPIEDDLSGFIDVIRVSDNPQKVSFGDCTLPARFAYKDPHTGKREIGHFVDEGGNEAPLVLGDGGTVRLQKATNSHNIKFLKLLIASNRFPAGFKLKIIDHAIAATESKRSRHLKLDVQTKVRELEGDRDLIASLARRIGIGRQLHEFTVDQVYDYVMDRAGTDPQTVLNILNDQNRDDYFTLDIARELNLIHKEQDFWMYGGQILGKDDEEIMFTMRQKPEIFSTLRRRVNKSGRLTSSASANEVVHIDESKVVFPAVPGVPGSVAITGAALGYTQSPSGENMATPIEMSKLIKKCKLTEVEGEVAGQKVPVVSYKPGRGYYFGIMFLGASEAAAAEMLSNNAAVRVQLQDIVDANTQMDPPKDGAAE